MTSIERRLDLFYTDILSRINEINERINPLIERLTKLETNKSGNIVSAVSTLQSALTILESSVEQSPKEVVSNEEPVPQRKNILFFPHQGLGDQIVMFGYINYLLNSSEANIIDEVCIIARSNMKTSIEHLYSDLPKIKFYWLNTWGEHWVEQDPLTKSINGLPFNSIIVNEHDKKTHYLHNFGMHTQNGTKLPNNSWADSFYLNINLPASIRFSHFQLPSKLDASRALYDRLKERLGQSTYILIHDDPTRGRNVHDVFVKDITKNNGTRYVPVLYLGKDRYKSPLLSEMNNVDVSDIFTAESIFDYYHILVNAKECHFMDSSFACLTDQIKEGTTSLYMHSYIIADSDVSNPKAHINRNWAYVRAVL